MSESSLLALAAELDGMENPTESDTFKIFWDGVVDYSKYLGFDPEFAWDENCWDGFGDFTEWLIETKEASGEEGYY